MNLKDVIMIDYVIRDKYCNLKCKYCISNDFKENVDVKQQRRIYRSGDEIDLTLRKMEEIVNAEILQISGGEIFLIENIEEFIIEKSRKYKKIFIISNGTLLNEEIIKKMSPYKNIVLGISLDGHTLEMNSYRFQSQIILDKILYNIQLLHKYNMCFFINTVLHDKNIFNLENFLLFMAEHYENVSVFPLLLRGSKKMYYDFKREDAQIIKKVMINPKLVAGNTIMLEYFQMLYDMALYSKKSMNCKICSRVIELFDTGEIYCCPLNWLKCVGNVYSENRLELANEIEKDKIYTLLENKTKNLKCCSDCISHFDIINLFLSEKINTKDLKKFKIFYGKEIVEKLLEGKSK